MLSAKLAQRVVKVIKEKSEMFVLSSLVSIGGHQSFPNMTDYSISTLLQSRTTYLFNEEVNLTLSPFSFSNGLFCPFILTSPLMKVGVLV